MISLSILSLSLATWASFVEARSLPIFAKDNNNSSSSSSSLSSSPYSFSTLLLLGDSYTDDCNSWRFYTKPEDTAPWQWPKCPPPSVASRWSGGRQWGEVLADSSGLQIYNFAFSGSTSDNLKFPRVEGFDVVSQVSQVEQALAGSYLNSTLNIDVASTAAVIYVGTNDLTFFVGRFQSNQSTDALRYPDQPVGDVSDGVVAAVARLYAMGIKRITVLNNFPLQHTPFFSDNNVPGYGYQIHQDGPIISAFMQNLVLDNNALTALKLKNLEQALSDLKLKTFDTYSLFGPIVKSPKDYAYGPQGDAGYCKVCPGPTGNNCSLCPDPSSHVFNDPLHPSETSAKILAGAVEEFLKDW